jgi:uncharacterized protein YndB with AHSA1/START domain
MSHPQIEKIMNKVVDINAPISQVWHVLTTPELMVNWMMPDIELNIITDWNVGSPILILGRMNGINFENRGTVLKFEPEEVLQYSHWSSVSRLPDQSENYTLIEFKLTPAENQTTVKLTLRNFPTESIYKHLTFYWNITLQVLKKTIETQG